MQLFISLKFLPAILTCLLLFCARFAIGGVAKPAWQGDWEKSIQEAEREGAVTFYSNSGYGFVNDFQKKFPKIKVTVVEARAGDLISRIMTERRAGKYVLDIAKLGNTSSYTLYQSKTLQPISSTFLLPEIKDESKWWQGKHQYADPEGKYIFVPFGSVYIQLVGYNTDLVKPSEFKSYWDVLDAKWKGKIAVIDPRSPRAREGARLVYYHPELLALMMIRRRPLCARARIAAMTMLAFDSMGPSSLVSTKWQVSPTFCKAARGSAKSAP
jgi:hypothetical protein